MSRTKWIRMVDSAWGTPMRFNQALNLIDKFSFLQSIYRALKYCAVNSCGRTKIISSWHWILHFSSPKVVDKRASSKHSSELAAVANIISLISDSWYNHFHMTSNLIYCFSMFNSCSPECFCPSWIFSPLASSCMYRCQPPALAHSLNIYVPDCEQYSTAVRFSNTFLCD